MEIPKERLAQFVLQYMMSDETTPETSGVLGTCTHQLVEDCGEEGELTDFLALLTLLVVDALGKEKDDE